MNLAASPLNAAVFSFFVKPMSEDLGWSRSDLSWGYTMRLIVAGMARADCRGVARPHRVAGAGHAGGADRRASACSGWRAYTALVVFYVLFAISGVAGFGAPGGQMLTTVPIAKWFHTNRGRALAIATVGMPLGTRSFCRWCRC